MRLVKVAVANVKTTVGAVRSNVERAIGFARAMAADDVTLGVYQEQLVGGYPPEDLVQWQGFVSAQRDELLRFAAATRELPTAFVLGLTVAHEAHRYNAAAVIHGGRVHGVVPKEQLPTYNVFYEARTFSRGEPGLSTSLDLGGGAVPFGDLLFRFDWGVLAVEVCEDAWSPDGPMRRRVYSGAEIVANVSASPYRLGVQGTRREMLCTRSGDNQTTLVYANAVGGQDGLIFDGGGFVCQNGRLVVETPRFGEGWHVAVVDLDRTVRLRAENTTWRNDALRFVAHEHRSTEILVEGAPTADRSRLPYPAPANRSFFLPADVTPSPAGVARARDARSEFCEELLDALALGLGDYVEKNRFKMIGIALSGGRDSLLCLLIVWRYVQKRFGDTPEARQFVRCFFMPTRYSSDKTRGAAEMIAADLGVPFTILPIEDAFERELEAARAMLQPGEALTPITLQNVQARVRSLRMWNWANATGGLFVQTGNMSEKSVGYTTIGGDLEGALSLISNLPKTVVIYLIEYLNETLRLPGIQAVLAHPAGPELAANQEGEKELMPFPLLDACFALYAGEKLAPSEMVQALTSMFPELAPATIETQVARFHRMFTQSIYKWVQAPLGLHVGNLDLDRERALQLPVVESDEWIRPPSQR
jgi:NAD+ synthase (glutamine-hydrolysing)